MLIALSLFIFYLCGMGLLPLLLMTDLKKVSLSDPKPAQLLSSVLLLGLGMNYSLVLLFRNLSLGLYVGAGLSIIGFLLAGITLRKRLLTLFAPQWFVWIVILYFVLLYSGVILYEPLAAWDARSIWFFQAKLIYYNHGLDIALPGGWNNTDVGFSHVDYPKLLPILAAQSAQLTGYWNEYAPKLSLLLLLLPALFSVAAFAGRVRISFVFLLIAFFFTGSGLLWNGYADGYLALYAGIACLYLGTWFTSENFHDLLSGGLSLSIVVSLKNEGSLYAIALLFCLIVLSRGKIFRYVMTTTGTARKLLLLLPFTGFFIWNLQKLQWSLHNDLQLGAGSFLRLAQRIEQGQLNIIFQSLAVDARVLGAVILLLLAAGAAKAFRRRLLLPAVFLPAFTAILYFAGIVLIYASTPHDLQWHLATSATRTMLPVLLSLFASTFFLLNSVEGCDEQPAGAGQKRRGKAAKK